MSEVTNEEITFLEESFVCDFQCQGSWGGRQCAYRAAYRVLFTCPAKPDGKALGFLCRQCLGMLMQGYRVRHAPCAQVIDPKTIRIM